MQNTKKGYILPMVLIVILLGLAGYFIFAMPQDEKEVVTEIPVQPTSTPDVEVPVSDDVATTTQEDEPVATSTATTSLDISAGLE